MRRPRLVPVIVTLLLSACEPVATPLSPGALEAPPASGTSQTQANAAPTAAPVLKQPVAFTPSPSPTPTPQPTPVAAPSRLTGATVEGYVFTYVDPDFPPKTPPPIVKGAYVSARSTTEGKPYFQDVHNASPNYQLNNIPLEADIEIRAQFGDYAGMALIHTGVSPDRKFVPLQLKRSYRL